MSRFKIKKQFVVEYAHRLLHHKGACHNLHGHSGNVFVELMDTAVDSVTGMVLDFSELGEACREIVGKYDHAVVFNADDPLLLLLQDTGLNIVVLDGEPTAENFAKMIYTELKDAGFPVSEVTFFETAKNCASYSE